MPSENTGPSQISAQRPAVSVYVYLCCLWPVRLIKGVVGRTPAITEGNRDAGQPLVGGVELLGELGEEGKTFVRQSLKGELS